MHNPTKASFHAALLTILFLANSFVYAQSVELDKIVVTPSRYEKNVATIPASISIINQKNIQQSGAQKVSDILRSQTGIVVRDWYGNAVKTTAGSRGFGENDPLNIAVLIDGRKVNAVDQSGVDWTQVPLNEVERIEIVRGGNSVLYGDNAVSAVVNIITKKGKGKPSFEIGSKGGSYSYNAQTLSSQGSSSLFDYAVSTSRESNQGYRNNSYFKTKDFATKFGFTPDKTTRIYFNGGYHRAAYGLPGGLSNSDIQNFSRTYSRNGDDSANDKDTYYTAGISKDFQSYGALDLESSFRLKKVLTNLINGNGGWNPIRDSNIATYGFTTHYKLPTCVLHKNLIISTGVDVYRNDYASDNFNTLNQLQDTTDITKLSLGYYMYNEVELLPKLNLNAGFRYEAVRYDFSFIDNSGWYAPINTAIHPNRKAFSGGLSYAYSQDSNIFVNINQNFRFPAVDEYFTGTLNTGLKPQMSRTYEAGFRHWFNDIVLTQVSGYLMPVNNELFTNPVGGGGFGATENYEKTMHKGIELQADWKIIKLIRLFGNYAYSDARFKTGFYNQKRIPMVPTHKTRLGIAFTPIESLSFNLATTFNGERYRINDSLNALPRLKSYFVTDFSVGYTFKDLSIIFKVNNIFNRLYSEFATYGVTSGNQLYYPSPERNFIVEANYKF